MYFDLIVHLKLFVFLIFQISSAYEFCIHYVQVFHISYTALFFLKTLTIKGNIVNFSNLASSDVVNE